VNTVLYNCIEEINNAVKKDKVKLLYRQYQQPTEKLILYRRNRVILWELLEDNALMIVNYVLSMRNEINLSDGYRKLNMCFIVSPSFSIIENHTKNW
jgi:hypothetical protein